MAKKQVKSIGITSDTNTNDGKFTKGEFRSGPVKGTALVGGVTFARKGLQYAEVEGLAIFEGDIVLGNVADVQTQADAGSGAMPQFSIGITGQQFRWPNATIPYDIDAALPNQQRVTDAIAHWQANTRIRFVLRTAANSAQYPDYVHFQPSSGCSSMVGRQGGRQDINLASGCTSGNAIHEIGHAIGLWHEQSREDRDTFVRIVWANIDPSMQHNFSQHIADGDDLGAYDYGSIMHYPRNAFSTNGQDTIIPLQALPPGTVMGQRTGLSPGDIAGVHMMYPVTTPTIKEVAKDPASDPVKRKEFIKDVIKDIRKDPLDDGGKLPIRDTIKEIRKDPIRDTLKEIRKDPIFDIRTIPIPRLPFDAGSGYAEATPFVLATSGRAANAGVNMVADAEAQVQDIANAIAAADQQQSELLAAYEAAVQNYEAIRQQSGY